MDARPILKSIVSTQMFLLIFLAQGLMHLAWAQNASVCTVPAPQSSGMKKPSLPNVYDVHVECIIENKNMSTEVHEYYDGVNNVGSIRQRAFGVDYYAYYDYNDNEFLGIFPKTKTCTVSKLSSSDQRFLFGYNSTGSGGRIYSAAGAIHFSGVEIYKGTDVVRGINITAWYSCQYWKGMDATMNVWWYFTDKNTWQNALGIDTVPVRARVTGYVGLASDGTPGHYFNHVYDFIDFKNYIARPHPFETPSLVSCPGRHLTKRYPGLSTSFSMTVEVVDTVRDQVTYWKEWYEHKLKLVKFIHIPEPGTHDGAYGFRPLTEIHDFNTGVAYVLDTQLGNCTCKKIETGSIDDLKTSNHDVKMRTASQFFFMNTSGITYEGVKTVRSVLTDTFVGKRNDYPAGNPLNTTFEWHFLTTDYARPQTPASGVTGNGIPVQLVVSITQMNILFYYNMYNYVESQPDLINWDISSCYRNLNKKNYDFTVPGSYATKIKANPAVFKMSTYLSLVGYMGVSGLRVSHLKIVYLKDVHIRFTLLDVAPVRGDVAHVVTEVPISVAEDILKTSINTNQFVINLDYDTLSDPIAIVAIPQSIKNYIYEDELTQASGYGGGAMGGLAIGMILVGAAGGAGGAFFFFK